ncbi:hypothetical protein GCM10023149_51430 [Mucilaginibacter gynuensis]|uniref:Peptidase M56 domain-containing protein n=1 Tax=Mucilaginibacter gynuensis TaxID=1302236 RepID=A0ABP8HJG6_9SPHI
MKTLIYLLQVSACTGLFYLFYFLCLRRLTFFTLNRWYLIGSLALSFVIPALSIPVSAVPEVIVQQPIMQQYVTPQVQQQITVTAPVAAEEGINWMEWIKMGYYAAAIASMAQLLITLVVFAIRTRGEKLMQIGNVKVLKSRGKGTNSSFMNIVFLNDDELNADEIKQILAHEMLHVRLFHSADRLLVRLVQIILWFNPFVYAYIRSIEENHEFEVDQIAARDADKGMYANLLLRLSIADNNLLYHSFSKVPLKMRISMLFNKPSSNMKKLIYVLMLPVAVVSCLAFANFKTDNGKQQQQRISAVGKLDKLGPHPLVIIQGKEYSDELLYTISGSCISSSSITAAGKDTKYGAKGKDGVVEIRTNGKIVKMTAIEKGNLIKEAAVPEGQFYTRLRLKNNDGTEFDKVIFHMPSGGGMSNDLQTGEIPAYVVDNKLYTEADMAKIEEIVKANAIKNFGTGNVSYKSTDLKVDLKGYNNFFYFTTDTTKYRQKVKRSSAYLKSTAETEVFKNSAEFKQKTAASNLVLGKAQQYKVTGQYDSVGPHGKASGYKLTTGGYEYTMRTQYGQEKQLKGELKIGDMITLTAFSTVTGKGKPVDIQPASIVKNGEKIFQLVEADKIPQYPFLYEVNKVRFTDGQVTAIQKYPNGKWKSAVVEVVNGYKIKFNIKPNAPTFDGIEQGDHVRFRFVNEVKTGAKEYTVNNWVSLSSDIKNYGIKNPDVFYKFYEKA